MTQRIDIDPVTRVEGHSKITLILDDQSKIADARFVVKEFRGFEKMCEGTLAERLPMLTSRICGICPVSHQLASVKAIEDCFGTKIPPTATKLRELMHLGQVIESHVLSLAVLSLPDLIADGTLTSRNIVGLYQWNQEAVEKALALRAVGTAIVQALGRRQGHPISVRIGGMVAPLDQEHRDALLVQLKSAMPHLTWLGQLLRALIEQNARLIDQLGDIQTGYLGLSHKGSLAFYDGTVKAIKADASPLAEFPATKYFDHVTEKYESWSYMKFPAFQSGERFRVGPLARVNLADQIPTPLASCELEWFRQGWQRPAHKTLCYHYARFIELVYAFERAHELLTDVEITSTEVVTKPEIKAGVGVGVVEAPRGTLVHRYELDDEGKTQQVDLFVATQHNNYGFNDALKETASKLIVDAHPDAATLNQLEMIVRAYDPCLSCATHALGESSFKVELVDRQGNLIQEWR